MHHNFPYNRPLDMDFIHRIQEGLPTAVVESLIKQKTFTRQELYSFISPRTWARRVKEHRLSPEESERIAMIERLIDFAEAVFGDKQKAYLWLRTPNPSFEDERPFDLIHNESGRRLIETILGRIQHGIYS